MPWEPGPRANRIDRQITSLLATPARHLTMRDVIVWIEGKTAMHTLTYTPTYTRADGSVWCMQEDAETGCENECRMVVDTESGLSIFLPDYLVDVHATRPASRETGELWPVFRWATTTDLHTTTSE